MVGLREELRDFGDEALEDRLAEAQLRARDSLLAELEADRKARDAETFSWEEAKRAAVEVRSRCVK